MIKKPAKPESFHIRLAAGRTVSNEQEAQSIYRAAGMDGWVLNLTVDGRGRIGQGGTILQTNPGTLILFPPHVVHDYSHDPQTGHWTHLWVYFFPRAEWIDWMEWPCAPGGIFLLPPSGTATDAKIRTRFESLIAHARGLLARRFDFAMNALEEILLLSDTINPRSMEAHTDERVRTALTYICDNFRKTIAMENLADACNLSPSRLSHLFRAEVGMTPMQYLEQYRLQHACELLAMTARTISAIARDCGYDDPLYFSRVFHRRFGLAPRTFRQNVG